MQRPPIQTTSPLRRREDVDPRLRVLSREPLTAETPLVHHHAPLTPNDVFYVRNHFAVPKIGAADYRLAISGEVLRPLVLDYRVLRAMPCRSLTVTLECAGNGRSDVQPPTPGEPWGYGAVGTAEWTGVPLRDVLAMARLAPECREVVFEGADSGHVQGHSDRMPFARSLPREVALDPATLLAFEMNGEPLSHNHGFPIRLIVPGVYGVASVKWLRRIEAIAGHFDGYFQGERYVVVRPGQKELEPLGHMRVRAVMVTPLEGASLRRGPHEIEGYAWSGAGPIERVEVSSDGGATWDRAALRETPSPYAWVGWRYEWRAEERGEFALCSRAFDTSGATQPEAAEWNRFGYANNAIQTVTVSVR
ncbi:MAG: sulfite oxidase [Polyangiaceae bacterium]|nr:sulfite oxidase [Polyangiaceae bacterium]